MSRQETFDGTDDGGSSPGANEAGPCIANKLGGGDDQKGAGQISGGGGVGGSSAIGATRTTGNSGAVRRRRRHKKKPPRSVLNPDENGLFYWLAFLALWVLYNLWTVVVRLAFPELQQGDNLSVWNLCDGLGDAAYVIAPFFYFFIKNRRTVLYCIVHPDDQLIDTNGAGRFSILSSNSVRDTWNKELWSTIAVNWPSIMYVLARSSSIWPVFYHSIGSFCLNNFLAAMKFSPAGVPHADSSAWLNSTASTHSTTCKCPLSSLLLTFLLTYLLTIDELQSGIAHRLPERLACRQLGSHSPNVGSLVRLFLLPAQ